MAGSCSSGFRSILQGQGYKNFIKDLLDLPGDTALVLGLCLELSLETECLVGWLLSEELHSDLLVVQGHLRHASHVGSLVRCPCRSNPSLVIPYSTYQALTTFKVDLSCIDYSLQHLDVRLIEFEPLF